MTPEHFVAPKDTQPMAPADRDGDSAQPSADGGGDRCDRETSTSPGQKFDPVAHHQPLAGSGTVFNMSTSPGQQFVPMPNRQPLAGSGMVFSMGAMSTSPGRQFVPVAYHQPLAGSGTVFNGGEMSTSPSQHFVPMVQPLVYYAPAPMAQPLPLAAPGWGGDRCGTETWTSPGQQFVVPMAAMAQPLAGSGRVCNVGVSLAPRRSESVENWADHVEEKDEDDHDGFETPAVVGEEEEKTEDQARQLLAATDYDSEAEGKHSKRGWLQ